MERMWYSLEIDLSALGRRVESQEFRMALASSSAGWQVDPSLFHYQSDGKTNTSPFPEFRITTSSGGKIGIITGVGLSATQYLMDHGHRLTAGVAEHFNFKRSAEYRTGGVYQVIKKPYCNKYLVPTLVFQRSKKEYRLFREDALKGRLSKQIEDKLKKIIRQDILMHGDYLGIDIDPDFTLEEIEVEKFCPVKVKGSRFNLAACGVKFRCSLLLQGVFNLGYLKSRGKGQIFIMRDQSTAKKSKEGSKEGNDAKS